ncbi:hypothetical protein CBS14141_000287 [Malassezia furfur]|nr:hypothetical protein CBS14141_000287 [Malassezia furfur]
MSAPHRHERDTMCPWSVQVDAPESLASSIADLHEIQEPSILETGRRSECESTPAPPPADADREPAPPTSDTTDAPASPSLRSMLVTLLDRLYETFSSHTPPNEPPAAPPAAPPRRDSGTATATATPPSRAAEQDTPRVADEGAQGARAHRDHSEWILDAAADALRRVQERDVADASPADVPEAAPEEAHVPEPSAPVDASAQEPAASAAPTLPEGATEATSSPTASAPAEAPTPAPDAADHEAEDSAPESATAPPPSSDDVPQGTTFTPNPGTENGPQYLMYIPRSASPFPFGFLYDTDASLVWPILDRETSNGDGGDAPRTVHVVGFPFRVSFTFRAPEPEEQPDPERAAQFVQGLEQVDAELRKRMSRFGISDLGADVLGDTDGPVTGCGVCLEPYARDDRPAWFVGEAQHEKETVVVVPCAGFHTLHASCLRDWLANTPPNKWACPFCRAPIGRDPAPMTLVEHVRLKEREVGWRCDAPACLPCFPNEELPDVYGNGAFGTQMIKMHPCNHEVHMDCLCVTMSVEYDHAFVPRDELDDANAPPSPVDGALSVPPAAPEVAERRARTPLVLPDGAESDAAYDTVGKWVTCPACRKDVGPGAYVSAPAAQPVPGGRCRCAAAAVTRVCVRASCNSC